MRLGAEDARAWQRAAAPFVCLYVVGTPLAFAAILRRHLSPTSALHLPYISPVFSLDLAYISPILRYGVRPALLDTHDHAQGAATLQWERRCLQRFSLLYAKYKPQRYWYEAVELPRKLLLTGVLIFVSRGSAAQARCRGDLLT